MREHGFLKNILDKNGSIYTYSFSLTGIACMLSLIELAHQQRYVGEVG
jgi:hypothetical protein